MYTKGMNNWRLHPSYLVSVEETEKTNKGNKDITKSTQFFAIVANQEGILKWSKLN